MFLYVFINIILFIICYVKYLYIIYYITLKDGDPVTHAPMSLNNP